MQVPLGVLQAPCSLVSSQDVGEGKDSLDPEDVGDAAETEGEGSQEPSQPVPGAPNVAPQDPATPQVVKKRVIFAILCVNSIN